MDKRSTAAWYRRWLPLLVLAALSIGLLASGGAPDGYAGAGSGQRGPWHDAIRSACRVSTHIVLGTLTALDSLGQECGGLRHLRAKMAVKQAYRGFADTPDSVTLWLEENRRETFAVGESWFMFATAGLPQGHTIARDGEPEAFFRVKVNGDSVQASHKPGVSIEAFLDTLGVVLAVTPVDRGLLDIR